MAIRQSSDVGEFLKPRYRTTRPKPGRPERTCCMCARRLLALVTQLLAQQCAEARGAGGRVRLAVVIRQCFLLLVLVLRLDRQLHGATLAIVADDLGFDFLADLQNVRSVVDTITRDVARR